MSDEAKQVDSAAALQSRRQPQPGDVLDGIYRLEQQLGRGGVGVVYKAFHLHLQRPCAIKFMHPQLVSNPELRTRFRREAQSAFQLGHPNIVAITDFRDDPNAWPYLVMELVNGETLRDGLEHGPLAPPLACRLMTELCDALSAAHRRGVIHRDLKPENLFLCRVESPGPGEPDTTLKVLDFGLSKLLDGAVNITGIGRLLGSPSYMSPEQARGDSHLVDARSDIFAVGVILYECLVGEKMFSVDNFEQKRQQIVAAKLPPLRFAERGLPVQLEAIITRACALRPEDRYQTAAALMERLDRIYKSMVAPASIDPMTTLQPGASGSAPRLAAVSPVAVAAPATPTLTPLKLANPDANSTGASVGGGEIIGAPPKPAKRGGLFYVAMGASVLALGLLGVAGYTVWQATQPPKAVATPQPLLPQPQPNPPPVAVTPVEPPSVPVVAPIADAAAPVVDAAAPVATPDLAELAAAPVAPTPPQPTVPVDPQKEKIGSALVPGGEAAVKPGFKPPLKKWTRPGKPFATAPTPGGSSLPESPALQDSVPTVNGVMKKAMPGILRCYPADTAPPPKISVDLTVEADGKVSEANVDGADDQASCVLGVLRSLRFTPPADGGSYSVRYDFVNLRR